MEDKRKFSLVYYLEGETKQKVREIQNKLFTLTGARACLDSWEPHITVGDGIWITSAELQEVEKSLQSLVDAQKVFEVRLEGFGGCIDRKAGTGEATTPYALWIDVVVNDALRELVAKVQDAVTSKCNLWWEMPQPYAPHATVAFRDLSKEGYEIGKDLLKEGNFQHSITISHIALVENLPSKDLEYKRFYFTKGR